MFSLRGPRWGTLGYGFVEFDSKDDFINAYKQAGKMKLDGKRLIVDYERGNFLY